MPMDRMLWKFSIEETNPIHWPCPSCGIPSMELVPDSFHTVVDMTTAYAHRNGRGSRRASRSQGSFGTTLRPTAALPH
jgi:hypothetical protein